jgi:tetratricopeptide (TPR) repeat protein
MRLLASSSPRAAVFHATLLSAALFAVYAAGASRTIYVGDSGELVTAVHLLGIPHPSGYPLYVLLGKLWTLLVPVGSVAFRMSLFSAACAGAACGVLYLLGRRMNLSVSSSLGTALLLAFGPSFWSQANIQRVYSLNALFVLLATLAAWHWRRRPRPATLALAALLCGLGACNHLFMAVYAVCLGLFVVAVEPALLRRPGHLALAGLAFLAGLAPYAYLPLRSRADPRLDWGNPESWRGFLDVVFRRDFWDRAWYEGPADLMVIGGDYLRGMGTELAWGGLVLAALGLGAGWRWRRFVLLPLLVIAANLGTMAMHGSRVDLFTWHRYYLPSYVMAALLAGLGWEALRHRLPRRAGPVILLLPLVLLISGWREHDRSRYRIAEEFSTTLLEALPPGAHLIATDDNVLFSLMYLHLVEKVRPDVNLILQGVGGAELPPLHFDPDADPVFFTHHPNWREPRLEIVPVGLVFRAVRAGGPRPVPVPVASELAGELDRRIPRDFLTQNLIGHYHYMLGITHENDDWLRARREFRRAAEAAPGNDVLFYNLGLIFRRNGLLSDALESFRRSHEINPRHLASHGRPRAADRIREVEEEARRLRELEAALDTGPAVPGTAEHHRALAAGLAERGELVAARGHRLRALEIESR